MDRNIPLRKILLSLLIFLIAPTIFAADNLITNSRFGVWSTWYWPQAIGTPVNVSSWSTAGGHYITCYTTNTQRLAVGKLVYLPTYGGADKSLANGGNPNPTRQDQMSHLIYALQKNTSFSFYMDGNSVAVNPSSCSALEVEPGTTNAGDTSQAMDWWYKSTSLNVYREFNYDHAPAPANSFYVAKLVKGSAGLEAMNWAKFYTNPIGYYGAPADPTWLAQYRGATLTLGAWVRATTATGISISLSDGIGETGSVSVSSDCAWHWLEVTQTISTSATVVNAIFYIAGPANSSGTICNPMLIVGSTIGTGNYQPIRNEAVTLAGRIIPRNLESDYFGFSGSTASKKMRIESETGGEIPRGIRSFEFEAEGVSTKAGDHIGFLSQDGSDITQPFYVGPYLSCQVSNILNFTYGSVGINQEEIEDSIYLAPAGCGFWTVSMNVTKVFY